MGRYEIVARLGAGGMGVVYKARDPHLDRFVALKLLPPHFADPETRERFLREARAASALDHPAICTIYEIGEDERADPYLSMAYYEGETLRQRLERGALSPGEALALVRRVGEGLQAAHARGIVHRDVKPANLFLTVDGQVKILDFGLAQRAGAERVTRTGTIIGTIAYMSPEQVRGDDIGPAADIWALGVVLYECLTGLLPFSGRSDAAILQAVLTEEPAAPSRYAAAVSPALDAFLARLLAKDQASRPADMPAVLAALDELDESRRTSGEPAHAGGPPTTRLESASAPSRAEPSTAGAVAILGFDNLTRDPAVEWLGGAITESIAGDLKRFAAVAVTSREAVKRALGPLPTLDREAAEAVVRAVGARWAVWGRFQAAGRALRIDVELHDAAAGRTLEPIRVDGTLDEIFALEDRIAELLAARLDVELSSAARAGLEVPPTELVEAYEHCARGVQLVFQMNPGSFAGAAESFAKAIELDPGYALAHSGLGHMRAMRYIATTDPADLEAAIVHLRRASELDPELADPHLWLTYAYGRQGRYEESAAAGRRAIELEPENALAHYFLSTGRWFKAALEGASAEEWAEAAEHIEIARRLAPRFQSAQMVAADLHLRTGGYRAARRAAGQAAQIERSGDFEKSRFVGGQAMLGMIELRQGEEAAAWATLEASIAHLEATDHVYSPAFLALGRCLQAAICFRRHDYSAALPLLRRARQEAETRERALAMGWMRVRIELGAAAVFSRLNMVREQRAALAAAQELLAGKSAYDWSGAWGSGEGELLYELGDCQAVLGQRDAALASLERAVAAGWREHPRLAHSPGFARLAAEPPVHSIRERLAGLPPLAEPA